MRGGGGAVKSTGNNPDERGDTPVLITEAAPSFDEQHAARKRKYITMMALRLPCLFLALIFAQISWWLALGFLLLSIPLPWAAVLIANDRPPRKAQRFKRYKREQGVPSAEVLERSNNHQVIEG
ncbi:DUF3099 domain-containing protein [Kibdelosporangium aridum]|uniref:DUF3099 domain-containing protein n=1 Tax=Kibdelosporangium aridum TaxID=2030 RepID=UPI000A051170|nr:DUF3099 domain-containing protein [Kibdelosporangium aridum]